MPPPTPDTGKLLARASKPAEDALRLHPFYRGKLQVLPKCAIRGLEDFAVWYSPGVAAPGRAIQANPELVYGHTNKGNSIAIVTDGTRVLGLGDIGPEAGLPVMEGKAMLFKCLGGVDAVPICLATKDPDELVRTVKLLEPNFGGIDSRGGHPAAHGRVGGVSSRGGRSESRGPGRSRRAPVDRLGGASRRRSPDDAGCSRGRRPAHARGPDRPAAEPVTQ